MKEYKPLSNDQRLRLKEILEDLTQNTEVLDKIGEKYRGQYYRYLSKLNFFVSLINDNYSGITLMVCVSNLNELKLNILIAKKNVGIGTAINHKLIKKHQRFNCKVYLERLFLLPKWKRSPFEFKKDNNRNIELNKEEMLNFI